MVDDFSGDYISFVDREGLNTKMYLKLRDLDDLHIAHLYLKDIMTLKEVLADCYVNLKNKLTFIPKGDFLFIRNNNVYRIKKTSVEKFVAEQIENS
jgi:hypothetical protein